MNISLSSWKDAESRRMSGIMADETRYHSAEKRSGRILRRIITGKAEADTKLILIAAFAVLTAVMISVTGMIASSPFGLFMSEKKDTELLRSAVRNAEIEFLNEIRDIRDSSACSQYVIRGHSSEWKDVLSVYAVIASVSGDGRTGLNEFTEDREELIRNIHSGMNRISCSEEEISAGQENGRRLVITVSGMTAEQAAERYGFSGHEKELLAEMLSFGDGYWEGITGGYSAGMGMVPSTAGRKGLGMFGWPLSEDGYVTSGFGTRRDPFTGETVFHGGTDIAAASGTPVLAAADGTVMVANGYDSWGGGYGYHVMIEHGNGFVTLYGHCSFVCVTEGQQVRKGEMIAGVGTTGNSTGDHLHFEIRENGVRQDPMIWFL